MAKTINVTCRPPIRRDDSQVSATENPGQSEDYQNDSQSFIHTESGSDVEAVDDKYQPYLPESYRSNLEQPNGVVFVTLVPCMLFTFLAIFVYWGNVYSNNTENLYSHNTENVCSFEELRKLYPEQEPKVWKFLTVGIESILKKHVTKPGVYLFVHQSGGREKEIVRHIATRSSSCFGKRYPVEMESKDFISDEVLTDYGHAIKKFKEKIQNGNVILIANLNEIPAKAARALHAICDTESPISPDIVIFLTLTVPNIEGGNTESITEDALNNLWGQQLADYELDALITRVTDQVIALKS